MKKQVLLPFAQSLLPLYFLFPFFLSAQPKIQLVDFASGFSLPVDIAHCGDNRLFIVEKRGYIWMLDSLGNRLQDTFLNIDDRVLSVQSERGLLGLAFPPNYAETGHFFVNYTRETDGDTRISRFTRNASNPNKANPNSELILLTQNQPFANHNGGCLKFGPDGYLYIGLGDGGSGGDPDNYAQNKNSLLGKILRIDVSNSSVAEPYAIPPDNPFMGDPAYRPEIWSLGWRNPWRFSFDRLTGDLWVGDVGQNTREEVDFEPAGTGGRNYGWRCYEGTFPFNTNGCQPASNYTGPVFDYDNNSLGCSVTGGFLYRGAKYADLYGKYLFTDYCSGRWWMVQHNADGSFSGDQIADLTNSQYVTLGEDRDGELYVAMIGQGRIQKINELCSSFQLSGQVVQQNICTGTFNGIIQAQTTGGAAPVNFAWSNAQTGNQIIYLEAGLYSVTATDANGCERIDTIEMTNAVPDPPVPVIMASVSVICEGDTIILNSSPAPDGYTYQWFNGPIPIPGDTGQTLIVYAGGAYQVQFSGTFCHSISESFVVNQSVLMAPAIAASGDSVFVVTPGNWSMQWYLNGQPISGANAEIYIAQESGFYTLEVTDDFGCKALSIPVYLEVSSVVSLPPSVRRFSLAPNPTENTMLMTLELEKSEQVVISLSDMQQRQIFSQTKQDQNIMLPIDLSNLPAGTYFLRLRMESGGFVRKVMRL